MMKSRRQLILLVAALVFIGLGGVVYKHWVLDFPLLPQETETLWTVEAKIEFEANAAPAMVKLSLPPYHSARRIMNIQPVAKDYHFDILGDDSNRSAIWQSNLAQGKQTLYLRYQTYFIPRYQIFARPPTKVQAPLFEGAEATAATSLLQTLADGANAKLQRAVNLLNLLDKQSDNSDVQLLLKSTSNLSDTIQLATRLLALDGIYARPAKGFLLEAEKRGQKAVSFIEIYTNNQWHLYSPREKSLIDYSDVIIVQSGKQALLEVFGGKNSSVTFATQKQRQTAFKTALHAGQQSTLLDLSIYSLPLADQNTFKLLLMIPLGAFVVVILRNLVGIRTSGTFMPILIALAFMQTQLLAGIALLLTVVSCGLILRSYLSRLNLLLVPRISAVVVFIIIIYAAIGIITHKLGLDWGLRVTFFPMIILSWTVERMSILWEEEGPHEVLIQGGGSLLTAILAYLLMSNSFIANVVFIYPELLLVVLAVIILIGSYTGYRLSDLRRFEPIEHL